MTTLTTSQIESLNSKMCPLSKTVKLGTVLNELQSANTDPVNSGRLDVVEPKVTVLEGKVASLISTSPVILSTPPLTSGSAGNKGEIAFDTGYLYVCIATTTWIRIAKSAWA